MKTLTRIQGLNFKGTAIDAQFSPLTAIVGRNTGGKTAVANAITLAVLGHLPALGRQPGRTVALMTPGAGMLDIRATFDGGGITNRTFKVNAKGAVSSGSEGVDLSDQVNPCQLDFNEFRNAKPTDRQRILESLMAAEAGSDVYEDARAQIAKAGLQVTLSFCEGWLLILEASAKDQARLLKQEIDTAAKTILQLSAVDPAKPFDATAAAANASALADARQAVGAAQEAFDELSRRQMQAPERPDGEPVSQLTVEALEVQLAELRKELDGLNVDWRHYSDEWSRAEAIRRPFAGVDPVEATSEPMTVDELATASRKLNERKSASTSRRASAKTKLEAAVEAAAKAKARRDQLTATDCCPTCGTKGATFAAAIEELTTAEVARAQDAIEDATAAVEEAAEEWKEIEEAEIELHRELKIKVGHDAWRAARDADAIMAAADKVKPTKTAEFTLRAVNDLEARRRAAARAVVEWQAFNQANTPTEADVEAARLKWDQARNLVVELESVALSIKADEQAWNQHLADQKRLAELTAENVTRETEVKAAGELAGWAKVKSLEVTAAAMKPILDVCNIVLANLVEGQLAIAGTVVGVERDGSMLPLEVLSGSEAAAVAAALQVAIAGRSPFRFVMVDELSTFEPDRKRDFLRNLNCAIKAGQIDQVIVFDHDPATADLVERTGGTAVRIG